MQTYSLIGFDLDETLTKSKEPLTHETATLLSRLLATHNVAIVSGRTFADYQERILDHLPENTNLANLYLLPLSGCELYVYKNNTWEPVYQHHLSEAQVTQITEVLENTLPAFPHNTPAPHGTQIHVYPAQVSVTIPGGDASLELRSTWDPHQEKRRALIEILKPLLPEFSIRIGGLTSVDITQKGMNKAHGIRSLSKYTTIPEEEMLYIGDALYEGGNDETVLQTNAHTKQTSGPEETKEIISSILT